jgi:hypothetical protein
VQAAPPSLFFFKQKENRGNPLHYPKYIKHKIKDNTTNWGDINLTQLTFLQPLKIKQFIPTTIGFESNPNG